jgi:hypothetical protein
MQDTEFVEISIEEMLEYTEQEALSNKKKEPGFSLNKPANLSAQIKQRKSGITNDSFDLDVLMFEQQLNLCEWPNEFEIYDEVSNWDFTTPTKECFDRVQIVKVYAKLNAYRVRLGELIGIVSRYHKIAATAQKSLKETAHALYTGTASERNAHAGYRVRPFELEALYAEGLLSYLTETGRALDSMFMNLSANLKHIDNLVRVNHGYEDEGISMNYQSMMSSEEIVNDDTMDDFYKPDPKPVSRLRTRSRGGN